MVDPVSLTVVCAGSYREYTQCCYERLLDPRDPFQAVPLVTLGDAGRFGAVQLAPDDTLVRYGSFPQGAPPVVVRLEFAYQALLERRFVPPEVAAALLDVELASARAEMQDALAALDAPPPKHPAKYSQALHRRLVEAIGARRPVLDPMAGVGTLAALVPGAFLNELEGEWAAQAAEIPGHGPITITDARYLPYPDGSFWAVCCSPTYGNRMGDHHDARERCRACAATGSVGGATCEACGGVGRRTYVRHTYRHYLGRPLTDGNTGAMQWGEAYRATHQAIWAECHRLLADPDGDRRARLVLNVSDHFRGGKRQPVSVWHRDTCLDLGFTLVQRRKVPTPRQGHGQNGKLRPAYEDIWILEKTS